MRRSDSLALCSAFLCAPLVVACAGSPVEAMGQSSLDASTSGELATTHGSDPSTTTAASASDGDATGTTASGSSGEDPTAPDSTAEDPTGVEATTDASATTDGGSSSTGDTATCRLLLDEVFNDPDTADDGLEWVELYNPCEDDIDLAGFSLAWGGETYADALDLVGTISAGGCFVVGGPMSSALNADPVYDQAMDFSPDLQNTTNGAADAVALFDVPAAEIDVDTLPIDAVIYGDRNVAELPDETGTPGVLDVPAGGAGQSYVRIDPAVAPGGDAWDVTATPSPGTCPNPPPA
ncbi:MAG: lamin tail domain-containing protein [Myxococcales bacterium]|nr:lamin tail domain-containing protein [Myxococcales bacterium]